MSNQYVEFNPIQCTSKQFASFEPAEGFLYFLTDTKQLFIGRNHSFIEMCGGVNLRYGIKEIEYDNSGIAPDPNVTFYIDELEDKELPLIDDLILNTDGCFYRVKSIEEDEIIKTIRLTLQGTGTGGGSTGGGAANLRISHYGGQNRYFSKEATKAELGVVAYSDDATNYISSIECSFDRDFTNTFISIYNLSYPLEKPYYIDIIKYFDKISTTGTKIYLRVTDKFGSTREIYYTVTIASLQLAAQEPDLFGIMTDTYDYKCIVGGSQDLDSRILIYELYSTGTMPIYTAEYVLEKNQSGSITKTLDLGSIAHGDYTLKVSMTGLINGVEIYSNELIHKVIRYREDIGQPIFTALIPENTEQYTSIPVSYLLVYGNQTKKYLLDILVDNDLLTTQEIQAGIVSSYNLTFDKQGVYNLKLNIAELGISFSTILTITEYTGVLPVINLNRDDLKVYLTARGRTNNASDKDVWPDYKTPSMQGTLENFYYRSVNGWLEDSIGNPYLKVSQGAQVTFDAFSPYDNAPKTNGLTIELDFVISGVTDYNTHLMECISRDANGDIKTGFAITGDTFKYYASNHELVSLNLVQNQRIKLSYVIEPSSAHKYPMCYTYLNGIVSHIHNYQSTDDFSNSPASPGYLKIDSAAGDIDIYNIRFYTSALDAQTVLNNYQATLDTLDLRKISYEQNLIRNIDGDIDLDLIEADSYNLQIPYVKLVGGYSMYKDSVTGDMMMAVESDNNKPTLPIGKKDYRAIDIEVHYPTAEQNEYFKDYTDLTVISEFEGTDASVTEAFGKKMTKGAWMYAQGTSSLEYPVKNLRVKLKGSKFTVRPDIAPVNLVTFKADYMESSGSHNTGAANYIDTAYSYAGMKTPGQRQFAQYEDEKTIVTCIKGHPCVIFWSPTGEKGTFEYIGKYNLNLDKATPEPFGFKEDENDEKFGFLVNEEGELVLNDKNEKQNSIFCFEFLDNNESVCNFISDKESSENINLTTEQERYYDTWYGDRINEDGEECFGWTRGFESRHPEDQTGRNDADALWPLASWLNDLYTERYINAREYDEAGNEIAVDEEKEAAVLQRFRNEYQEYLDPDFLLAYYVITEALLMADSRVKNMMIATWGKEKRTFALDDGTTKSVFNYIWYPIFYDMDTMLGLDNAGYVNKPYYGEDTIEGLFNGKEILWKFVRDALPNEVAQFYIRLEGSSNILSEVSILPYFNKNQANMANETFYNEDASYKYTTPYRTGYTNHLTGDKVPAGSTEVNRLYAAQGNRSMMREWFIHNRIKYLRGKYMSTNYQESDRIVFRLTRPTYQAVSDDIPESDLTAEQKEQKRINASIIAVPPTDDFTFTSMKTGFAGAKVGTSFDNRRFENEQTITLNKLTTENADGTETYLFGVSNLSDIGDLSNKYMYKFAVSAQDNSLKRLILGNHHKDYYNKQWKNEPNAALNLLDFKYLEEFNLENCDGFTGTVNLTDCARIKTILMNGSGVTTLMLPPSGVIEELRIPSTIKNFSIDTHPTLQPHKFTIGYYDYDKEKYVNDYSKLTHVNIKGTPINSYELARGALYPAVGNSLLETYCFTDVDWEITDINDVNIVDGILSSIKVLDKLLTLNTYAQDGDHASALTGTLTINVADVKIDEFAIYNLYHSKYPNLTILYGENVSEDNLIPAYTINFYNTENITNETAPYYTVLTNGKYTFAELVSATGPAGTALKDPVKLATTTQTFSFQDQWKDNDSDIIYNVADFSTTTPPLKNLNLVPVFKAETRYYTVTYHTDDGTEYKTIKYTYEQPLSANDAPLYLAKSDDDLAEDERYAFKGWISERDFNNQISNPNVYNMDMTLVSYDMNVYAHYMIENVHLIATDLKYFNITQESIAFTKEIHTAASNYTETTTETISLGTRYVINLKDEYKSSLTGKITLPNIDQNGNYITVIGDFAYSNINAIYFLDNTRYEAIAPKLLSGNINGPGWYYNTALKIVELPKTIKYISGQAFEGCSSLTTLLWSNNVEYVGARAFNGVSSVLIEELPTALSYIGTNAFFSTSKLKCTKLPVNLTQIPSNAFSYCPDVNIAQFGYILNSTIGSTDNKIEYIGDSAFGYSGDLVSTMTLGDSIRHLAPNCFYSYGNRPLSVIDKSGLITTDSIAQYFGDTIDITLSEEV